jgi:hypothetical protein
MNSRTSGSPNGIATHAPVAASAPWLQITVGKFFTQINWTDQTPEVQALQLTTLQGDHPELSLQLTVSQFFRAIPWDGKAAAAPAHPEVSPMAVPSTDPDLTIEDFADLF